MLKQVNMYSRSYKCSSGEMNTKYTQDSKGDEEITSC